MSQKFYSEVTLETLNNATTDTDRFLVGDSGTIKYRTGSQLLSDLGVSGLYVPYTGATGNVDLGTHTLSSYNLIVNHTSGSGVAASITKGGSGEALTINKTSGSGNAMSVAGGLTSLVDLTLSSIPNATTDTDRFIVSDGGAIKYRTGAEVLSDIGGQSALTNPITGTGTTNYVSKFTGATTLGDSQIFDNGTFVGIGTNAPNATLQVGNGTGVKAIYVTGSGNNLGLGGLSVSFLGFATGTISTVNTSGAVPLGVGTRSTQPLILGTNNAERMRIDSGGNVGIGTTSPASLLDVSGASPVLTITRTSGSFTNTINFNSSASNFASIISNSGTGEQRYSIGPASGWGGFHTFYTDTTEKMRIASNGAIKFNNYGSGTFTGTATQRLGVDSSGNVIEIPIGGGAVDGSGTTNYVTKWTDADTIGNSQIFDNGTNVGIGTASPGEKLDVSVTKSYNQSADIGIALGGTDNGFVDNFSTSSWRQFVSGNASGQSLKFDGFVRSVGWVERMRITSSGNVGIGTTAPSGKLHVEGNATPGNYAAYINNASGGGSVLKLYNHDWDVTDYLLYATNGGGYSFVIDGNGKVGIGTTSPAEILHLQSSQPVIRYTKTGILNWKAGVISGNNFTINNDSGGGDAFNITTSGNVGIGTTNPTSLSDRFGLSINGTNGGFADFMVSGTSKGRIIADANDFYVQGLANGSLIFESNSTEKMRITSAGNVGIGTTSPIGKFTIVGSAGSAGILDFNTDTTRCDIQSYNKPLSLNRQGNNTLLNETSGNVGIGTTSPSGKFEIDASGNFSWGFPSTAVAKIGTKGTGGSLLVSTPSLNSSYESGFAVDGTYSSGKSVINLTAFGVLSGGPYGADIAFRTTSQSTLSEKMRITSDGNVGIGTTSPNYKLQVVPLATYGNGEDGNISINTSPSGGTYSNTTVGGIVFGDQNITNNYAGRIAVVQNSPSTSTLTHMRFYTNSGGGNTATLERMRILGDGSVGIGTTTPGFATSGRTVLTLNGPTSALMEFQNGGVFKSYLFQGPGGFEIYDISNIQFSVNGGERMRVASNGNVGIGTTSPAYKLEVNGSINVYPNNFFRYDGDTGIIGSATSIGGASNQLGIRASNDILFATNGANERMRITSSGNVGINTNAPIHKLSVNGKIGGDVYADSFVEFTATTETIVSADGNVVLGYAQNVVVDNEGSLGVGTIAPLGCAIVEIESTTQGFLPPRMNTTQRDDIASPKQGLMIFNTDDEVIQVYTDGSGWRTLAFL